MSIEDKREHAGQADPAISVINVADLGTKLEANCSRVAKETASKVLNAIRNRTCGCDKLERTGEC